MEPPMDGKDPPPFGYHFEPAEYLAASPPSLNNAQSLLSESENQLLNNFFSSEPFHFDPATNDFGIDAKTAIEDFNWPYVPPANVHQVSTSIPDQSQLYRHHTEHFLAPGAFGANPFAAAPQNDPQNDPQILQAASTLWHNNHAAHANSRSYSVPSMPSMHNFSLSSPVGTGLNGHGMNMIPASHGMMQDHSAMASLTPHHSGPSPLDAQVATQFHQQQSHEEPAPVYVQLEQPLQKLKRSYTYGTDSAFNPEGYTAPSPNLELKATERLLTTLKFAQSAQRSPPQQDGAARGAIKSEGEEPSEEQSDDVDGDERPKKRQKGKASISQEHALPSRRKSSTIARPAKNRKASVDEPGSKKKRGSTAGQKAQRENLTEEQKRSNHIMSEQKRRNLIKRGFDDLHDLVPEIRAGGLSKSSVLLEGANFLEKLIAGNERYKAMLEFPQG